MPKARIKISFGTFASLSALAMMPSSLQAQEVAEVEINVGSTLASNPFLLPDDDTGSVAARIEVSPTLAWEDETSRISLNSEMRYEDWLDRYGSEFSGNIQLSATRDMSESLSLYGVASARTSKRTLQDYFLAGDLIADEAGIPAPVLPFDPAITNQLTRRNTVSVSAGASKLLSTTQSLRMEIGSTQNWLGDEGIDYRTTQLDVTYGQRLNTRSELFIAVGGTKSDYVDQIRGDGRFANATVGLKLDLSETGSFTADIGAAIASVTSSADTTDTELFLIANMEVCERILNGSMCATASRESRPTTLGGASSVTSAGFGWNKIFRQRSNLSLNVRYSSVKASLAAFDLDADRRTQFAGLTARYSHRLTDKFGFFVAPSATKIFNDSLDRGENLQITFGVGYTFGR